jgi:hypothetical protein
VGKGTRIERPESDQRLGAWHEETGEPPVRDLSYIAILILTRRPLPDKTLSNDLITPPTSFLVMEVHW